MLQINPGTRFPIVRKLGDPTDVGTNYVRAVVRNSLTGDILKTIDLSDQGGQRFLGYYNAPAYEEVYFDITTTVYTDSGYTTKSDVYSEENSQYLGATRWSLALAIPNGEAKGVKVDYDRIKKLLKEGIKEEIKETKPYNDEVVVQKLSNLQSSIDGLEIPQPEKVDFSPILEKIDKINSGIIAHIDNIEKPEPVKFDSVLSSIEKVGAELKKYLDGLSKETKDKYQSLIDIQSKEAQDRMTTALGLLDMVSSSRPPEEEDDDENDDEEEIIKGRAKRILK